MNEAQKKERPVSWLKRKGQVDGVHTSNEIKYTASDAVGKRSGSVWIQYRIQG